MKRLDIINEYSKCIKEKCKDESETVINDKKSQKLKFEFQLILVIVN